MEHALYPLKFKPQAKATVWGNNKLNKLYNKKFPADKKIGESWELSAMQRSLSVAQNGFLKGNNIEELTEIYMGELVGDKIYEHYGFEFPLLIKLIDAAEALSVQVHPDDEVAMQRHNSYGKTEMWYILDVEPEAQLYIGFNRDVTAEEFYNRIQNDTLLEILNCEKVKAGDVFFIPPGTIHAIGKGIVLAEIQQTSNITYRVYDWGREHDPATAREMHVEHAIDVIDYKELEHAKIAYKKALNTPVSLIKCPYFNVDLLDLTQPLARNFLMSDTFAAYVCTEGNAIIHHKGGAVIIDKGETVLIPASISNITIEPSPTAELLETYIP